MRVGGVGTSRGGGSEVGRRAVGGLGGNFDDTNDRWFGRTAVRVELIVDVRVVREKLLAGRGAIGTRLQAREGRFGDIFMYHFRLFAAVEEEIYSAPGVLKLVARPTGKCVAHTEIATRRIDLHTDSVGEGEDLSRAEAPVRRVVEEAAGR